MPTSSKLWVPRWMTIGALLLGCTPVAMAQPRLECLIPAYQYPTLGDLWPRITAAAPRIAISAIVNPANGPGAAPDPNYVAVVTAFRAAGGQALGYVPTGYTDSSLASVIEKVDRWRSFHALDGFFIDETTSDTAPAHLAYYATIDSAIRARGAYRVILNPGTAPAVDYLTRPCGDAVVVFENRLTLLSSPPPTWVQSQPWYRSASLVYQVPTASDMRAAIALIAARGEGLVYVTDDSLANPWDRLPPYWDEEVAVLETTLVRNTVGVEREATRPGLLSLSRAQPDPSRGSCRLRLSLERATPVQVTVHDAAGRRIAVLMDGSLAAGEHWLEWDGRNTSAATVPAGIYWLRAASGSAVVARGVVRLR